MLPLPMQNTTFYKHMGKEFQAHPYYGSFFISLEEPPIYTLQILVNRFWVLGPKEKQ